MASIKFKMPDDFLDKIKNLGNHTDEVITKVLQAGAEVVESEMRSNLQGVIGKGTKEPSQSTGQLLASLGTANVMQDRDGVFNVKVGFAENRNDGKSNAMIASVLEYGKSITDACLGWDDSAALVRALSEAVLARREYRRAPTAPAPEEKAKPRKRASKK